MAGGGKMDARQRMINMMYLVLTALLALQVSASIVEKFVFLYQSMEHSKDKALKATDNALEALKKKVKKEGNSSEGVESIRRAEELKKKARETILKIEKIRNLLVEAGGGEHPHHVIENPKETTKVEEIMLGGEQKGEEVKAILTDYVNWINKKVKSWGLKIESLKESNNEFEHLALDNAENKVTGHEHDASEHNKTFAEANFGQTPVIAALAILVQKETEVIRYEQTILKELGAGDLSEAVKFDKIVAMASAESSIVAAGTDYKAQMFVSASSKKSGAQMSVTMGSVKVDSENIGEVTIPTSGTGERTWEGRITIKNKGKDTTFTFKKTFMVVEPVLIVNTAAGFPLYQNCANELETAVPALGASYSPSFSVTNGSAIPGAKTGSVTIYPTTVGSCVLKVSSSGSSVGSKKFKVNPVPPPTVTLVGGRGTPINLEKPIPAPSKLNVKALPDKTFAETLPKEANYRVASVQVTQYRGGASVKQKVFNTESFAFRNVFSPRKGDGFNIKVTSVQRINSKGTVEPAPINRPNIQFYVK